MEFKKIVHTVAGKAGAIAKSAAKKTGEAAGNAKLAITYKSEKIKLEKMFTTLGKLFYEQTAGTDVRAQIVAQIMEINEQKKSIEDIKALMEEVKGKASCPGCGKSISIDAAYCPVCGQKLGITAEDDRTKEEIIDDIINTKGLDTDGFVSFFNETTDKYF